MAKNESSKSKAEIYREERKARIAKAAKQNAKSIEKRTTATNIIKKVVAIVLAVVIVGFAGFKIVESTGLVNRLATAVEIGDTKVSAAEYNYYYISAYNSLAQQAQAYEQQYGANITGFDTSVPPDEQESTQTDENGNKLLWSEVLKESATARAQQLIGYYNEAVAADTTLTDDQKAEIKETVETFRTQATENNYSLNAYLKMYYGAGFNEKVLTKQLEKEQIVTNFLEDKESEFTAATTDEDVAAEYKKNQKLYDYADIRYYTFSFKALTKTEGETDEALKKRQTEANSKITAEAEGILAKITDENSFIDEIKTYSKSETDTTKTESAAKHSAIKSATSEKAADWVFAADRKAGDKTVITADSAAYIIYVVKPAYNSNSVNVRHCLVEFDAKDSENVTDEEKIAAHKQATELLKGLGENVKEDDFAKMATDNTADTGSSSTGGLYENVRLGQMVENFEKWCFDPARKAGDTGIVETEYGYHIMYFVKSNTEDVDWKNEIKNAKVDEKLSAYQEELFAEDGKNKIEANEAWVNRISDDYCDIIRKNLAYSQMYS